MRGHARDGKNAGHSLLHCKCDIEENYTRNLSQYGKIQTQGTQNTEQECQLAHLDI